MNCVLGESRIESGRKSMKFRTSLPQEVHAVTYVKNSHYIELEDDDGNSTKLDASGVVKYECSDCKFVFLSFANHGDIRCPLCGLIGAAKPQWYVPQLSFVPEKPSTFTGGFNLGKDEDKGK